MKNHNYQSGLLPFSALLFVAVFFSSGCKKLTSDFSLKKYEYAAGDALEFENLSINDKNCKWEIKDEEGTVVATYEELNPVMVLSILAEDGPYTLELTAYNGNKKKESIIEKPFLIKSEKFLFSVNHNISPGSATQYSVYIDGQYLGKSSTYSGHQIFQAYIPKGLRLIKLVSADEVYENTHYFDNSYAVSF